MLPPSGGRLNLNSGGASGGFSLDDQIRGMRPPGYRAAGLGGNAFNALSAANLSQETGLGHMTNIGSNLNFGGMHPMADDR